MIPFELAAIFVQMQSPESRAFGANALAAFCQVRKVLVFGVDQEIGIFLPAPGTPQTLRGGGRWQAFLRECAANGSACASLPDPQDGTESEAFGMCGEARQANIVFLGGKPSPTAREAIAALLPLLGAKLVGERAAGVADGHAAAARESSRRAGALNAALDINRRELQAAYGSVERELVSRRQAESKLRDADRRKDEFLAMLAHELRNPLAPISMAAQILKLDPGNPARLQQTCQIIDRQVTHMTRLLDDLLDVSRVTGGMVALNVAPHDMRQIAEQAVEQARPLLNARAHHLTITAGHGEMIVSGDCTRLVQIVTNLLNNAAKYTSSGGEIGLDLALRDEQVVLTVRDNGIGIDEALLPHVFDLFIQGERSPDRSQGGLGLGLALVRSLVRRHGGTVSARSAGAGLGSEFEVSLPREAEAPRGMAERASGAPDTGQGLSILIVDDNVDAAGTLAMFLQAMGHSVQVAADGAGALAIAELATPQVLLLDIGLPDMDGYQLAQRLHALPAARGCVSIALTGYGRPEDRERSRAAGFEHHLTKPVDPRELVALLAHVEPHARPA
jgi:signal transduction histidine kinase/ActR/RegA family two-component response regulator